MSDFKSFSSHGQLEEARWKNPKEWPVVCMEEEVVELHNILVSRRCSSLQDGDVLAWSPNPKGVYTISSGYQGLLSQRLDAVEVHWWKNVWNKFSWSKCNCFIWTLARNRCLTWDNIRKRGFEGPSIYVLCEAGEEDSYHLFFHYPFAMHLWHSWWGVWKSPCVHASSLVVFWSSLGRPPPSASFL